MGHFKTFVNENAVGITLSAFLVLFIVWLQVQFALTINSKFDGLHDNICAAVANSAKGNPVQYKYWIGAANRATQRAASDKGTALVKLDEQAARDDRDIAAVFAPSKFKFPGCN